MSYDAFRFLTLSAFTYESDIDGDRMGEAEILLLLDRHSGLDELGACWWGGPLYPVSAPCNSAKYYLNMEETCTKLALSYSPKL